MSKQTILFPNLWLDVKSDIELRILRGEFSAGERVPSVRKIADDYGVGQSTAQKVLKTLWAEGIIEPQRGIGFFVKPYIREQLAASRKKILEKRIIGAVEEADLINMDLLSMVEKYVNMKKEQK